MRAPLLALAVLSLATLVPSPATAQAVAYPMITVHLAMPPEPLVAGVPTTFTGTMTFTSEATAMAETGGIQVVYTITEVPEWATISFSPSSDVIQPGLMVASTFQATRMFTLTVIPTGDAPVGEPGIVIVRATSAPTRLVSSGSGQGVGLIIMGEHVCDQADATPSDPLESAAAPPAGGPAQEAAPVHQVQTASVVPVSLPWAAVAGCAALGAAGGYLLRKRRR